MSSLKYPLCYCCDKIILKEGGDGTHKTSLGEKATPSDDYRSVDIHLSDGERIIAFATPVCKDCLSHVLNDSSTIDLRKKIKERLIINCKKEKNWGFGDNFFDKPLSLVNVVDLTNTLVESGIIKCQ